MLRYLWAKHRRACVLDYSFQPFVARAFPVVQVYFVILLPRIMSRVDVQSRVRESVSVRPVFVGAVPSGHSRRAEL